MIRIIKKKKSLPSTTYVGLRVPVEIHSLIMQSEPVEATLTEKYISLLHAGLGLEIEEDEIEEVA